MVGSVSDVVDLMLLPLLEQHESVITKREAGTLSVDCKLGTATQKHEEQRAAEDESPKRGDASS